MPNQPKTPITSFRLDPETKERIARQAEAMNTTMTEAVRRASIAVEQMIATMRKAWPEEMRKQEVSTAARDGLADFLVLRDWPSATPRQATMHRRNTYSVMAAAILNGEAWAIRKAWPEAAYDIKTRSDWPGR